MLFSSRMHGSLIRMRKVLVFPLACAPLVTLAYAVGGLSSLSPSGPGWAWDSALSAATSCDATWYPLLRLLLDLLQGDGGDLAKGSTLFGLSCLPCSPGTSPHAPGSVRVHVSMTTANVSWEPGYDGGYEQTFSVWYGPL